MKAKFFNPEYEINEEIDTDNLLNDSGDEWTEDLLKQYILDVCPRARNIEII
jgi:hypothetical protein